MPRRGTRHVPQSGHATTGRVPGYNISRLGIVVLASSAGLPLSRMQSPTVKKIECLPSPPAAPEGGIPR